MATYHVEGSILTIPGSPAYVAKATHHRVNIPEYGMTWSFEGRNAIQGSFRFSN